MVKIVGHRGAAGYEAENTIRSFKTAIKVGCDKVELDVRLSKDNRLVVFHDEEVSRVTDGEGFVHELTLAELKELKDTNQKIPTLQEVIDCCKGKIDLQIELKANDTTKYVNDILLKNDLEQHVVITSFDVELLHLSLKNTYEDDNILHSQPTQQFCSYLS